MRIPSGVRRMAAAVLFLCGGILVSAQQTGPEQPPAFRSGVDLVTVDVGVIDGGGRPVRGLGPADFSATVGGQPRRIVSAEFVDMTAAKAGESARADVVPVSTNDGAGLGRLFLFVVDQETLDPGNGRRVARAASRFFSGLTFADRSALMFLPVGPNVGFTWAHDRVLESLQRVGGRSAASTWEFGSLSEARDIANRNAVALRTVSARECGESVIASGVGSGLPTDPGSDPSPGPGGTQPGGASGGTGAAPAGGSQAGGGGTPAAGRTGAIGGFANRCISDIQMQAESTWRSAQMTSLASVTALRHLLTTLARIPGEKTVVLISGGWPLDEFEQTSLLATVAAEAASARTTFYTLFAPAPTYSVTRRVVSSTPATDHQLLAWPLETLAAMTGGGSFRAETGAEAIFERLSRELAGYYRLGIEKDPSDFDGQARRLKVQVSRSGVSVRAREIFDIRTYEDRNWAARLASALDAPIPASGVGLRVTSYVAADPDDATHLKLVLAGEASRLHPGEATFQLAIHDLEGRRTLSGEQPLGEATEDGLRFSAAIPVAPGSYIVRIAVIDSAGRVGSVDHRAEVRAVPIATLSATGPLLVRVPTRSDGNVRFVLDTVRRDERLALEVGLAGDTAHSGGTDVVFEIAATAEGPALISAPTNLVAGSRAGSISAQAVADLRALPAGDYVARARVTSGSGPLGEVRRAFTVIEAPRVVSDPGGTRSTPVERSTGPAVSAVGAIPPFTVDHVLTPQVLGAFLDRVAARPDAGAPGMRELLEGARTSEIRELVLPDPQTAEPAVTAFLRGLTLLAQNQLDAAAHAFRSAIRASPDFYPAMVYLGACYAAGGKDKEAAGAWQTALIQEADLLDLHLLLTDAFLRQERGALALEAIGRARARWPEDDGVRRRFALAAFMAGQHRDGFEALSELIDRRADDETLLEVALRVLYEAFASGRPVQGVDQDRAQMIRLAEVYRARGGRSLALVDAWLTAVLGKQ